MKLVLFEDCVFKETEKSRWKNECTDVVSSASVSRVVVRWCDVIS